MFGESNEMEQKQLQETNANEHLFNMALAMNFRLEQANILQVLTAAF